MQSKFDIGPLATGQKVGLFGGSFDPPHLGHILLSRRAIQVFDLDLVIWLVSPGNPLKANPPAPVTDRVMQCRRLITHSRVRVSAAESLMGTRYTAQTLQGLQRAFPGVRFVWLMGADNLVQFHQWHDWRGIIQTMPVGVLARPGFRLAARNSVTARAFRTARVPDMSSRDLANRAAPAWCFANMPLRPESSSAIRAAL